MDEIFDEDEPLQLAFEDNDGVVTWDGFTGDSTIASFCERLRQHYNFSSGRSYEWKIDYNGEFLQTANNKKFKDYGITCDCCFLTVELDVVGGCFLADTQILMSSGKTINIQDIKINDKVYSYDVTNEKINAMDNIYATSIHYVNEYIIYKLSNGEEIKTTPRHGIFIKDKGYVTYASGNIKINDKMLSLDDKSISIVDIQIINLDDQIPVYLIYVEKNHNMFVKNVLVHNGKLDFKAPDLTKKQSGTTTTEHNYKYYTLSGGLNYSGTCTNSFCPSRREPGTVMHRGFGEKIDPNDEYEEDEIICRGCKRSFEPTSYCFYKCTYEIIYKWSNESKKDPKHTIGPKTVRGTTFDEFGGDKSEDNRNYRYLKIKVEEL